HRVVRRQIPALAVLFGRHVVGGAQMPLQHLQLLAVLEADDVVRRDRLLDRHRRIRPFRHWLGGATGSGERVIDIADQGRQLRHGDRVVRQMGGQDVSHQWENILGVCLISHWSAWECWKEDCRWYRQFWSKINKDWPATAWIPRRRRRSPAPAPARRSPGPPTGSSPGGGR